MPGATFEPFDLLVVPFPFTDPPVSCRVRLKIFTLDQGLMIRRTGALAAQHRQAVEAALSANLAAA